MTQDRKEFVTKLAYAKDAIEAAEKATIGLIESITEDDNIPNHQKWGLTFPITLLELAASNYKKALIMLFEFDCEADLEK